MSRRGMHPLLMGLDNPHRKFYNKPLERHETLIAGLESTQHNSFFRAEAEEETEAEAG